MTTTTAYMAVLHRKPSRRGALRPQLWIDPNPLTDEHLAPLPTPASSADLISSLAPLASDSDTATPTSSTELFYVLCLYDYDAEDSDQLSFRRNDILDVVKKEDTVSSFPSAFLSTSAQSSPGLVGRYSPR